MSNQIYKYPLKILSSQTVEMPEDAYILNIQMQRGQPVMWAAVDTNKPKTPLRIRMLGTGTGMNSNINPDFYLGTVQEGSGMVWHYFSDLE